MWISTGLCRDLEKDRPVVLEEAAERYLERFPAGEKIDMGVLVPDEIPDMVRKMARLPPVPEHAPGVLC